MSALRINRPASSPGTPRSAPPPRRTPAPPGPPWPVPPNSIPCRSSVGWSPPPSNDNQSRKSSPLMLARPPAGNAAGRNAPTSGIPRLAAAPAATAFETETGIGFRSTLGSANATRLLLTPRPEYPPPPRRHQRHVLPSVSPHVSDRAGVATRFQLRLPKAASLSANRTPGTGSHSWPR